MDPNPPAEDDDNSAVNPPTYMDTSGGLFNGRFDKSDFKGCGTPIALAACALIIGGCLKQRENSRVIHGLQNLIEEVHTNLKKGKVRQAIELIEAEEAWSAQQPEGETGRAVY